MNYSIVVFCPNPHSLYTLSVCELLQKKGYKIEAIVVKKFSANRFFEEYKRDGFRLIKKIWKKLIIKEKKLVNTLVYDIIKFRKDKGLTLTNVNQLNVPIIYVNNLNDTEVEQLLDSFENPFVVFTGGGIIRENILEKANYKILNCHMGILPKYKGMDLPEWCLLENKTENMGFTLHFMDKGIDTGDILKKVYLKFDFQKNKTINEIRDLYVPKMTEELVNVTIDYINNKIEVEKQLPETILKQYFIIHPRLYEKVNKKIHNFSL